MEIGEWESSYIKAYIELICNCWKNEIIDRLINNIKLDR